MKNVIVKTQALKKYYQTGNQTVRALDGVNFEVAEREFVSIVGKSGSGKSTLLHMIGGLDTPSSGTVIVDGLNLETLNSEQLALFRRRKVGFIFQQFFLINSLNVRQNVQLPCVYEGKKSRAEKKAIAEKYLKIVGLETKAKSKVTELSGGQQQRVAIARSLVNDPLLIMADEPTGALDSETGTEIMELLKELNEQGKTIVMVTHDEDMKKYASRVIHMKDGRFLEEEVIR